METLHRHLSALLAAYPRSRHLIVGYSGGMDSHVLLHLLATQRDLWPERTIEAIDRLNSMEADQAVAPIIA